jgi:UDP-2,3-diacylglucosamine pyrophosphatase LpxH
VPLPEYAGVCEALRRLARRGVWLGMVPGNHDFAAGPLFTEELRADVRPAHAETLDGVRYHLAHGDEADASLGYRLTRATLRGSAFAALMERLGPQRGGRLLRALAGASRDRPAPQAALLEAQRTWAQARVEEGAQVVVLGHSHAPGLTPLRGGTLINLGDWRDGPRWLEVEGGVPTLRGPVARVSQASTRASVSGSSRS